MSTDFNNNIPISSISPKKPLKEQEEKQAKIEEKKDTNEDAPKKDPRDSLNNPNEVIGRSQVVNHKTQKINADNFDADMKKFVQNPEVVKKLMKEWEIVYEDLVKKGLSKEEAFEKASTVVTVLANDMFEQSKTND